MDSTTQNSMNKYYSKNRSSSAHGKVGGVIELVFILYIILFFVLTISINFSAKIFIGFILFLLLFLLCVKIYGNFRKKQINWLKRNGEKLSSKFKTITLDLWRSVIFQKGYIHTVATKDHTQLKFYSDIVSFGYSYFWPSKSKAVNKVLIHGENIDVWINPDHPNVYWVDTDFLKQNEKKYKK